MNKILRFSLMAILAIVGFGTANAGKIVFGELGLENGVQYGDPFDGGDFTVVFAGGNNDGKYYNTGAGIRVYGGGTMTITAKSGTLSKIQITYDGSYKPEDGSVVSTGVYDPATGIWTGSASEVVFTRPSGTGHWRIKAIATGSDVEEVVVPTEGQTPETAITVARALEIIDALAEGATSDATYYVVGFVTSVSKITSSGATFFMGDDVNATNTVQAYNLKGLGNTSITNTEFLKSGDKVVVKGGLQKYKNGNTGEITPEVSGGYVYSVNGKTEDTTPNPEDAINTGLDANTPMTVAQAIEYINSFSDGFTTSKQYYVEGTVAEVTEINVENGNATFKMGGLTVFRVKGLENKNIGDANYLKANDQVVVCAKLQKYGSGETATPELSSGYIYKLNGKTKEEGDDPGTYTPVGDGSKANPYTAQDILHMATPESSSVVEGQEPVWLKGFIVGALNSAGTAFAEDVASNIAIAETASETEAKNCVPVQLPTGTMRAGLNVVDNPENKGKDVIVCGYLLKYMSRAGLKNLTAYILNGEEVVAGINGVTIDQQKNGATYNLKGQRVNQSYKGLVIKNGTKTIQK